MIPTVVHSNGHSDTQSTSKQINATCIGRGWGCGDDEAGVKWKNVWE